MVLVLQWIMNLVYLSTLPINVSGQGQHDSSPICCFGLYSLFKHGGIKGGSLYSRQLARDILDLAEYVEAASYVAEQFIEFVGVISALFRPRCYQI